MKKIISFCAFAFLTLSLLGQAPEKLSYQAVVRDADDQLLKDQQVGMQISIIQGLPGANAIYVETQIQTTNSNGLLTIEIGNGIVVSGDFISIDWENGPFFIKTEIDPTGGNNYSIIATSELLSVPYALYAKIAGRITQGNETGDILFFDGQDWKELPIGEQQQILTVCDGLPVWTFGGYCPGEISNLDCNSAIVNGLILQGIEANGVSVELPYSGGNGGAYQGQSVNSLGVTGLTATLEAGIFSYDSGILVINITGVPDSNGISIFPIVMGEQSCTLNISVDTIGSAGPYPPGTVHCDPDNPTEVVDVTNPITGKTWMDRNLGASRVATASDDSLSFGDYYQWGRFADGHQCRDSETTSILSNIDQPGHNYFITNSTRFDWRNPQNSNLWQGINGKNNPCPVGYRLPTEMELELERQSWSSTDAEGALDSPLRLPMAGLRLGSGSPTWVGNNGNYWSSSVNSDQSLRLIFNYTSASLGSLYRADGRSVRCIKN